MKNCFVLTTDESLQPENNFGNNIDKSTTEVSSCEYPKNEVRVIESMKNRFTIILKDLKELYHIYY